MSDLVQGLKEVFSNQEWIDQAAVPVQKGVSKAFQSGGSLGQRIADFLHGVWLGHPLHPVLTDIPVGAWTATVVLDAMDAHSESAGLRRASDTALAIGIAGAAGSAVTGITDWQHTVGESRRTGFLHGLLNTVALGFFIGSLVSRGKRDRQVARNLALTGYAIAGFSAYLGGDLVFRQKIGVNRAPEMEEIETADFVPVLAEDQLPENRLTIALLNNVPLVLLRRGDQVYALAETCAHMGGPLADGELKEGPDGRPVVMCPWHGSHFDMTSGDTVGGPSTYPQPCFETRIRDGQIEVRHQVRA